MTTEALRKILTREFILAFFAQLTFTVANHILLPTLPIYLSRLGSKETEIGVLIGIFTVSSLVLRPFTGKILLRTPEKKMMIIGALLFGLASTGYLVALPFWPFFFVRVFQGIGYAFFYTASFTLIANISPEAHRGQSLSYFLLALNISLALGPSFGMFLINRFDFTTLFLVCLGLSFSSLFIISRMGRRQVAPLQDASVASSFFISREALPASVMGFFFFFYLGSLDRLFPPLCHETRRGQPRIFFQRDCRDAHFEPCSGRQDFGSLQQRKDHPPLPHHLYCFNGPHRFFQNAFNVCSCRADLGNRACLLLPFPGSLCSRPRGFFPKSSHGDTDRNDGFGNIRGTGGHGWGGPIHQLSGHVPLLISHRRLQSRLFLSFFKRQKVACALTPLLCGPSIRF